MKNSVTCIKKKAKYSIYTALLVIISFSFIINTPAISQIPDAGFESWTGGNPDGWYTSNNSPALVNITQTSDAHSGSSAVKGIITSISGFIIPCALITGENAKGYPINERPAALHGWYKFTGVGGDELNISFVAQKNGVGIGACSFTTNKSTGNYTEFVANTIWDSADTPDTAFIAIQISKATGSSGSEHEGSQFIIDDLAYGSASTSSVNDFSNVVSGISLGQNYPNPCSQYTSIAYDLVGPSNITLKIYNMLGQEVGTIINSEQSAGNHTVLFDAVNLPAGTYRYSLQTGATTLTKQLIKVD